MHKYNLDDPHDVLVLGSDEDEIATGLFRRVLMCHVRPKLSLPKSNAYRSIQSAGVTQQQQPWLLPPSAGSIPEPQDPPIRAFDHQELPDPWRAVQTRDIAGKMIGIAPPLP